MRKAAASSPAQGRIGELFECTGDQGLQDKGQVHTPRLITPPSEGRIIQENAGSGRPEDCGPPAEYAIL